ncbi:sulfurtransferase TusA [Candidatus Tachikawaea gelatinosa]|uniref:Sulfurtransferase TusA n=1 Tax=Candidatus Tachikawaea gelatinosa TaxID=1410383 RepID=A0A090AJ68_9ENTR|nr:sulfurtransferase TusA [Candidatus Tachikawaea gelatinosa]BAP58483.1 sulfurtransferase TusA [Candidatus Tachikawaea gelatinosa]
MSKKINKKIINLSGLRCPEPILQVRRTIRSMKKNDTLIVIADDPAIICDIENFCYFMQHYLLESYIDSKPYKFFIRVGQSFK